MIDNKKFNGFPKETLTFFKDLIENNDTTWFKSHKEDYQRIVLEPAKAFVFDMGQRLQSIAPDIVADTRTNGAGSIFRIYRDIRFSKDKSPYKTYLGILFWEGPGKKMENSGFYFHLDPANSLFMLAAGLYTFTKTHLEAYREAVIDEKTGRILCDAVEKVKAAGKYQIGGKHYKRTPRGYDESHPLAEYLLYNSLYAYIEEAIPDALFSKKLLDYCLHRFKEMAPIHQWLMDSILR